MPRRLGVTMRVAVGEGPGDDARDLYPDDWALVLATALPDAAWWPLANVGASIVRRVDELRLDAIILAGGNDLGTVPRRDETELCLVHHCLTNGIPLLGVCRGLQVVQSAFGGGVARAPMAHDAGRLHGISVCAPRAQRMLDARSFVAPSYHRFGVPAGGVAAALETCALSDDGWVEMIAHRSAPIVGVQWHPERPMPQPAIALRLLQELADAR